MTPTDFDNEANEIWAKACYEHDPPIYFAHAIRDLVLQGSAEPVAWIGYIELGHLLTKEKVHENQVPLYTRPQFPPAEKEELERLREAMKDINPVAEADNYIINWIDGQQFKDRKFLYTHADVEQALLWEDEIEQLHAENEKLHKQLKEKAINGVKRREDIRRLRAEVAALKEKLNGT